MLYVKQVINSIRSWLQEEIKLNCKDNIRVLEGVGKENTFGEEFRELKSK